MTRYLVLLLITALAGATLAGCSNTPDATTEALPEVSEANAGGQPAEQGDVELSILSFDEIQQRIADQRGKVVVMDAWSTSCPPCMKDFHNLVELHKAHDPGQLACISLSFDYEGLGQPEEVSEGVLAFLRSQGAAFDNFLSNEESDVSTASFSSMPCRPSSCMTGPASCGRVLRMKRLRRGAAAGGRVAQGNAPGRRCRCALWRRRVTYRTIPACAPACIHRSESCDFPRAWPRTTCPAAWKTAASSARRSCACPRGAARSARPRPAGPGGG